jgi:archaellum biogenesis ATPase FlaH
MFCRFILFYSATFPGAMVNHLMSVGIDDFRAYVNDITNKEKLLVPTATINQLHEEYQLKFRSLSAILAHLAKQQNFELRDALVRMLKVYFLV